MGFLTFDQSATMEHCGVKMWSPAFEAAVLAAEAAVRAECGPVLAETVTDVLRRPAACHVLSARPVTITTITGSDGTVYAPADHYAEGQLLRRVDGGMIPACTVVYSAGWAQEDIPAELIAAGRMIARNVWRSTLGNQRLGDADLPSGTPWLWPKQADLLAAPYKLAPLGFA